MLMLEQWHVSKNIDLQPDPGHLSLKKLGAQAEAVRHKDWQLLLPNHIIP
jgi:hypothetical protein